LSGVLKVHFGFAIYEVSELEHTINSLCHCAARLILANVCKQGAQNLRDTHARLPCHANPTVPFAHFVGAEVLFFFSRKLYRSPLCLLFGVREE